MKDIINIKICNHCGEEKDLNEFYSQEKVNSKGEKYIYHRPDCIGCTKKKAATWQKRNREKHLLSNKYYRESENGKQVFRKHAQKTRDEGKYREWQKSNPDKIKGYNQNRLIHKKHKISKKEWKSCKGYFDNSCAYCGLSEIDHRRIHNQDLHKEHVVHDGANDLSNCVPACKSCNSMKHQTPLSDWYNENNLDFEEYRIDRINKWLTTDYKLHIKLK